MTTVDMVATASVYAAVLITSIVWLFGEHQYVVHKTRRNTILISFRLAVLILLPHLLFWSAGITVLWLYGVILFLLLPTTFIFDIVSASMFVPLYWMWSWAVGWPDWDISPESRGPLFPDREEKGTANEEEHTHPAPLNPIPKVREEFIGEIGITITHLTPTGKVEMNGTKCEGRSQGSFIDEGRRIRAIDSDAFGLVVEEFEKSSEN